MLNDLPLAGSEYRLSAYQAQVRAYQARIHDYVEFITADPALEKRFKKWIEGRKRKLYESEHLTKDPDNPGLDPV